MKDFLTWLTSNPGISTAIIILIGIVVFVIALLYLVAFFQGREISFYPPKIGQKIDSNRQSVSGIKLEDRSEHKVSLEKRLANAKSVAFTGSSLIGILTHYKGFIQTKAGTGCKFRFLLVHPDFYHGLDKRDAAEKTEVLNAIQLLESLCGNANIKYKVLTFHPPFSLMMVDTETAEGFVQIEMYPYSSIASERPHFELTPKTDSKWYSFFREQFEIAWQNAQEYHADTKEA